MASFQVEFFKDDFGSFPVLEFVATLSPKFEQRTAWTLKLLQDPTIHRVPDKYFAKLSGGSNLWEVRVQSANNIVRILAILDGARVVLLHAFTKKTQKIPTRDIELANVRKKRYFARKGTA